MYVRTLKQGVTDDDYIAAWMPEGTAREDYPARVSVSHSTVDERQTVTVFEFEGDPDQRRGTWLVSNCPLKLINYETLTRDCDLASDKRVYFDAVVLDEAQRIKNRESKTAQSVRALN
ncbi:hypothetical protein, partial [uncultured Amnibacterium sp.]|uniref:hypothetical protein n=1 Tax=uncultured Amnibacterium sp. TaxID=1631851 RepID=UPI0035CB19FF